MSTTSTVESVAQALAAELPLWPTSDQAERDGLLRVLDSGQWWRTQGSEVLAFEAEFAAHEGFESVVAVTNGTHAIELALQAMGVGPGDEVIVPAFTFVSTGMAVARLGATPAYADVDRETYCLLPGEIARLAGSRTKVVIPVHMAGHPAAMDEIDAAAAEHGIRVLQDAAHAQGTRYRERRLGELGSPAIYSFQNGKLMTAGEGGAVGLPAGEDRLPYVLRHNCGRHPEDRRYEHDAMGSNFRLSEFHGAVLRAQLGRLDEQVKRRESNSTVFRDRLASRTDRIVAQGRTADATVVPHYMLMLEVAGDGAASAREELVEELRRHGIPIFHNYRPLPRIAAMSSPAAASATCPNSDDIWRKGFWLHHRVLLAEPDVVAGLADLLADGVDRS